MSDTITNLQEQLAALKAERDEAVKKRDEYKALFELQVMGRECWQSDAKEFAHSLIFAADAAAERSEICPICHGYETHKTECIVLKAMAVLG